MKLVPWEIKEGYLKEFTLENSDEDYPQVKGTITFTNKEFQINATVTDSHFKDGDRSWRYGDGFLINIITEAYPDAKPSPYFYAYGFSRMAGENHSVLVCHNGVFSLRSEEFKPEIIIDKTLKQASYQIRIPWEKLKPFHPLIDKTIGINIRYNSQNDDGTTKRLQLVKDENFESELVPVKEYHPVDLIQSENSPLQIAIKMETNLVQQEETPATVVIYSHKQQETSLDLLITEQEKIRHEIKKDIELHRGINEILVNIPTQDETASYALEIELKGLSLTHRFFRLKSTELRQLEKRINRLKEFIDEPLVESSYNGLMFKLNELKQVITGFRGREDPAPVQRRVEELNNLLSRAETHGHIFSEGYIRTAFLSPDDHTLQPYSMVLPSEFGPIKEYNLLVGLHGSGVDEVDYIGRLSLIHELMGPDCVIAAPRGRDLSDWYVGQTERDVIQMVKTIKTMLRIRRIILFGFSMGGYGAWRLTFLYPDIFEAAIIGSGTLSNRRYTEQEYDIRNQKRDTRHIPYLVMHGTEDRAAPFKPVEEFVTKLKEEGYHITFKVLEGAGHGGYDPSQAILEWMKHIGLLHN